MPRQRKIIVIGGSAGSIAEIMKILKALPLTYKIPIAIILHRVRNIQSGLNLVFSHINLVREPEDKEPLRVGNIYLAPQNYHLLFEKNSSISLDYSEPVHFSRPSIDVSFQSAAQVYGKNAIGVLLSGANEDGTEGIMQIIENGGVALVQSPSSAAFPQMPASAIAQNEQVLVLNTEEIIEYLLQQE